MALIHYPVINKNGETIASAITNLDLHDIARLAKTYGVRVFYVVTPLEDQKLFIKRMIAHWVSSGGSAYNPKRREAFGLVHLSDSLQEVLAHIGSAEGSFPKVVATCARTVAGCLGFSRLRAELGSGAPHLLVFGTAWGLAEEVLRAADYVLEPVTGPVPYNHLSVRTAAAIILDRLVGREI